MMKAYLDLVRKIVEAPDSAWKGNRTGTRAKSISGYNFEHEMSEGFPLLTTKKTAFKLVAVELEGFIKGVTDKNWFIKRGCHIWDDWCNPKKVPYGNDEKTKAKMKAEMDLGKIYGYQWRSFNGNDTLFNKFLNFFGLGQKQGTDQLKIIVDRLHNDPSDRRMICSAWNPNQLDQMALPPCHLLWQVIVTGENFDTLNLNWYQRSVDVPLGLAFNIASYALLLKLLAKEAGMKEGKLCGFLGDTHIYEDQFEIMKIQLEREPYPLPTVELPGFTNIYDWTYEQRELVNYQHHDKLDFPISV